MDGQDAIHHASGVELPPGRGGDREGAPKVASRKVTVGNSLGLHMRPVMQFVDLANQFASQITVSKDGHVVDGKNPMELMLLEATQGTELEIRADGPDADTAADALAALVRRGFGEE